MNFNPKRHVRQQAIYCPHCQQVTEQGVWIQDTDIEIFGKRIQKRKEYADCLACDNTDTIISKHRRNRDE